MKTEIRTTKDLAQWLTALVPSKLFSYDARLRNFIAALEEEKEEVWKKCRKCGLVKPISDFDNLPVERSRDGKRNKCKVCRRKVNNAGARRRRLDAKINPEDLAEIQRVRELKGLKPLPLGEHAPKPGRPKQEPVNE